MLQSHLMPVHHSLQPLAQGVSVALEHAGPGHSLGNVPPAGPYGSRHPLEYTQGLCPDQGPLPAHRGAVPLLATSATAKGFVFMTVSTERAGLQKDPVSAFLDTNTQLLLSS